MKNWTAGLFVFVLVLIAHLSSHAKVTSFANNGTLKMFYDNRMYPQAVVVEGKMFAVWRGDEGHPYVISCDLNTREFSAPLNLMKGYEEEADLKRYASDHHYAPVIWSDSQNYLHVLHGCHRTKGIHMISEKPGSAGAARRRTPTGPHSVCKGPDVAPCAARHRSRPVRRDRVRGSVDS